jgi:single-strand DNA-binding protein
MNKTILMGRLTKDPELRYTTNNNTAACSFTLAVNRKFSKQNEVDFFNIVAWDKHGEFCGKYFQKGRQVVVVGRLQVRSYDDNEGKKRYVTEVVSEEAYFADGKKAEGGAEPTNFVPLHDANGNVIDDELPF